MGMQESCLSRGIQRCGYHVCILGIIGSGKTTLAQALQKVIAEKTGRCEGLWEPVESNPLLPLYYKGPSAIRLINADLHVKSPPGAAARGAGSGPDGRFVRPG